MRTTTFTLLTVTAVVASACATGGAGTGDRNRITEDRIAQSSADNVLELIRREEPQWLGSRGPTSISDPTEQVASVYIDGIHMGDTRALEQIRLDEVREIRYWRAGEAAARFGMGHPRGVIEVMRK